MTVIQLGADADRAVLEAAKRIASVRKYNRRADQWGQGFIGEVEPLGGGAYVDPAYAALYVGQIGAEAFRRWAVRHEYETLERMIATALTDPGQCGDGGVDFVLDRYIRVQIKTRLATRFDDRALVRGIDDRGNGIAIAADWYVFARWVGGSRTVEFVGCADRRAVGRAVLRPAFKGRHRNREIKYEDLVPLAALPARLIG